MINTQQQFNDILSKNKYTLVKFGAPWCGPCRALTNTLKQIKNIDICEINVDDAPELVSQYSITNIPQLVLFKYENMPVVVGTKPPPFTVDSIQQWINEHIS